jgi:type III restriction enzyme
MFTLKPYQQETLDKLSLFLHRSATSRDIRGAYAECIKENYNREVSYNDVGFPSTPYVCLRLPTGGGKTILASHTISIVCREFLGKDFALVLWLVPSNAILEQTLKALRDRKHPYRVAIDEAFDGNASVLTVEDALGLTRSTLESSVTVIVSTLAAWRTNSTEGRKVYQSNGALKHHFEGLSKEQLKELEHHNGENSDALKYSLANVVHLNHPILLIDEAHNARTDLTFDTLQRLHPSCIVEYTATPKTKGEDRSNVLFSVSAYTLKAEHIIKLPIELLTTEDWQTTVSNAVKKQQELEELAKEEEQERGEYIRPIVLLQAEAESQHQTTIGVNEVKICLAEVCKIPEEQIAVATGEERGIEGIELLEKTCPIRFIITKQALKEGWDCPFAYVFCSVANVRSSKDVEQLLGRVLRMPNVIPKKRDGLNRAYAFVHSTDFFETANNLTDSLTRSGFTPNEAEHFLDIKKSQGNLGGEFFGQFTRTLAEAPEPTAIPRTLRDKVVINKKEGTITFTQRITEVEREQLKEILPSQNDKEVIEQLYKAINHISSTYISPQKKGEILSVPQLLIEFDGEMRVFDDEMLVLPSWDLGLCYAELSEKEFPIIVDSGTQGLIDIDFSGKPYLHNAAQIQQELTSIIVSSRMQRPGLIAWLVKELRHPSIPHAQSVTFINKVVEHLVQKRGLSIDHLVYMRFKLREAIQNKIAEYYLTAKKDGYQLLLGVHRVSERKGKFIAGQDFRFSASYPVNTPYAGNIRFSKHFYEQIGDMNDEEAQCALNIDSNPNVQYWVRNLERQEAHSFWLQTSTDKFYPDFVVKLKNGKILVVEYKGSDRYDTPDSEEKRWLGAFWEAASDGKCLFVMTKGKEWNLLQTKLNAT